MKRSRLRLLENQMNKNAFEGLKAFAQLLTEEDDAYWQHEMSTVVANFLRKASRLKRAMLVRKLSDCSLFCQLLISKQFPSVNDPAFPRHFVFYGAAGLTAPPISVRESYILVYGPNKNRQLGVPNGLPCPEPVRLNFPQCREICMGLDHTLFLKLNGEVFGCGLVSALTHGNHKLECENMPYEYFIEPTKLSIPDDEEVLDIAASTAYSILLTKTYIYIIGECNICEKYEGDESWIAENSKRFKTNGYREGENARVFILKNSIEICYNISTETSKIRRQSFNKDGADLDFPEFSTFVTFSGNKFKPVNSKETGYARRNFPKEHVIICQRKDSIHLIGKKESGICRIFLNGKLIKNDRIEKFVMFSRESIIVQFQDGFMAHGKLELCKNRNTTSSTFVLFLNEIPLSHGVTMFSASLNGENGIIQVGSASEYQAKSLLNENNQFPYWDLLVESFEKEAAKDPGKIVTNEMLKDLLKEQLHYQEKWLEKFPNTVLPSQFIALQTCLHGIIGLSRLTESEERRTMNVKLKIHETYSSSETQIQNEPRTLQTLSEDILKILPSRRFPEPEGTKELWHYMYIVLGLMKDALIEDGEFVEIKNLDGNKTKDLHFNLKVDDTESIRKQIRNDYWALSKNENPLDLDIVFIPDEDFKAKVEFKKNETLFRLMYPQLSRKIVPGQNLCLNSLEFAHIFHRGDFIQQKMKMNFDGIEQSSSIEFRRDKQENIYYRLMFNEPVSALVPQGTDASDVWKVNTIDKKFVEVHRNLLLLHSPVARIKMEFCVLQDMQNPLSPETAKPTFDAPSNEEDVLTALRALLDPMLLFQKTVPEIVEIIMFYDFMEMKEAFSNAVNVAFQQATPSDYSYLYVLYQHFKDSVVDKFVENESMFLLSFPAIMPPLDLIKKLEEVRLKKQSKTDDLFDRRQHRFVVDDLCKHFIDIKTDTEDEFWENAYQVFDVKAIKQSGLPKRRKIDESNSDDGTVYIYI